MIALIARLLPLLRQLAPLVRTAWPILVAIAGALTDYYAQSGGKATAGAVGLVVGSYVRRNHAELGLVEAHPLRSLVAASESIDVEGIARVLRENTEAVNAAIKDRARASAAHLFESGDVLVDRPEYGLKPCKPATFRIPPDTEERLGLSVWMEGGSIFPPPLPEADELEAAALSRPDLHGTPPLAIIEDVQADGSIRLRVVALYKRHTDGSGEWARVAPRLYFEEEPEDAADHPTGEFPAVPLA